jgi:hypothetical protein
MSDLVVRFVDRHGVSWTVWEEFDRAARDEPAQDEPAGALVFESPFGRRRLASAPPHWWDLPAEALERMCDQAEPQE